MACHGCDCPEHVRDARTDVWPIPRDPAIPPPPPRELPLLPCGHRTRHTQRIGCCSGCRRLFSSDSAFSSHRRVGQCLDPQEVGLIAKDSATAPGEVIWSLPSGDMPWNNDEETPDA